MSAACLVADSGPLIALGRLDLLGLPSRYFEPVLVTSSVWLEVTRKPGVDEAARLSSAAEHHLLRVVPDPAAIPAALLRTSIHAGERSSIALAIEREATLLLDDRRARRIAAESGRPVIGTLELLVRAREEGFVAALRPLIEQLRSTGYFMSDDLVAQALSSRNE
jgi:predicted nucleic acid-binding protein